MGAVRAREGISRGMVVITKGIYVTMWQTDMEFSLTKMGISIRDNGRIICPTDQGKLHIPTKRVM